MNERNPRIALITAKCLRNGEIVHVFDPTGIPGCSSYFGRRTTLYVLRAIDWIEIVAEADNSGFPKNALLAVVSAVSIERILLAIFIRDILVGIELVSILHCKTLQTRKRKPNIFGTCQIRSKKAKISRTLLYRNIVTFALYALYFISIDVQRGF